MFTQDQDCQYCSETQMLVEEVSALSENVHAEIIPFDPDETQALTYGIDKVPAIVVLSGDKTPRDYGIRYYGIPSGYEFTSLIEDIFMVAEGKSGLSADTQEKLAALTTPVHLQVFVTPT